MKVGRRVMAVAVALALAAGCGGDDTGTEAGSGNRGAGDGFEPVTVTDCNGVESTVEAPPERVVTLTSPVLETMFWLGVEDRVIGTGSPPKAGQFPEQFDEAAQQVPKLAGEGEVGAFQPVPREVLIGNDPDFVIAGWESNFGTEGAASQSDLADRGIDSYMAFSVACSSALTSAQEDLDLTYRDLENLGRAFGIPETAEQLIAGMEDALDGIREQLDGIDEVPTVFPFEYDEGTDQIWAAGNRQVVNAVISLAGGQNIFHDFDSDYERVGWEEIIRRDPDVILIITYAREDAEGNEKAVSNAVDFLTSYEPIQNMTAVQEQSFVNVLYEEASAGGVRNADAVVNLAAQLHGDGGE